MLKPQKLSPACKDYIWGGTKLKTEFDKECNLERLAETWELSCHPDGPSLIADGEDKGRTLAEYIEAQGKEILGSDCEAFEMFPVLVKLIDARDNLSVQVHPDDEYAMREENSYGKTEMWYIVDCDPGAQLIYGMDHTISKEEFQSRIESDTLLEAVHSVPVKKGDVFFIEAGTLHAIGKGIVIAEIQQNSNLTYRVYDFGRLGADGKPRPLHREKALAVTRLERPSRGTEPQGEAEPFEGGVKTLLSSCKYFTVNHYHTDTRAILAADSTSFQFLLCLDGEAKLHFPGGAMHMKKGEGVFVPAGLGTYPCEGACEFLLITV